MPEASQTTYLSSSELGSFIDHIIKNNQSIQSRGLKPSAVEINGMSGLGKTSIVVQKAAEHNLDFVKLNLAQIEELGDLVGFPLRQYQVCKTETVNLKPKTVKKWVSEKVDGKVVKVQKEVPVEGSDITTGKNEVCIWVDEHAVQQYASQGYHFTGKKRMTYAPPEWISDKGEGGILLLDDWNRADPRFVQATMELCDRQEYISWKLPKNWHIILTANPDNGEYMVQSIDLAQRTRFISVNMKWDVKCWAEWAEKNQVDGRCINFVLMNPDLVKEDGSNGVNPRSLTNFFNAILSFDNFEDTEALVMIQMIGAGSVGEETATMFASFIANKLDKLITPEQMLLEKDDKKVSTKLWESICDGFDAASYRADIASILATRFINFTLNYASKNKIEDAHRDRIAMFLKDPQLFTDDLKYHIAKKIVTGNKAKFGQLLNDTVIVEYVTK